MNEVSLKDVLARYEAERKVIIDLNDRGRSALVLASMALEHGGSGAEAAAKLLLSMDNRGESDVK